LLKQLVLFDMLVAAGEQTLWGRLAFVSNAELDLVRPEARGDYLIVISKLHTVNHFNRSIDSLNHCQFYSQFFQYEETQDRSKMPLIAQNATDRVILGLMTFGMHDACVKMSC
jgi:hypothetical protein